MPFADTADVAARLGRSLSAGETTTVEFLLDGATAVVAGAVGMDDAALSPVPPVVRFVTVEVVCRALANPNGLAGLTEQLGQHSYTARFRDPDGGGALALTKREELLVRSAVYGTTSGSSRAAGTIDELHDLYYGS